MPFDDVRVLIVGESPLARAGLAALLANQTALVIVGQTAPDADLPPSLSAYQPDALVWDLGWDAQRALEALADARDIAPPILVLLADDTRAVDALNAGARGILSQNASVEWLTAALVAVARGLVVVSPQWMSAAISPTTAEPSPADALTPRELEVLALVAEGLPNKTIAARLGISEHTVKFHINAVMGKLGAQSRTDAVVRATRLGLITL